MIRISLLGKIMASNLVKLKRPYKLTLAVTNRCNSRCLRCGIWKSKMKNEWSKADYENFFKKNNYLSWIDITGGEVFLRKDLVDIVQLIKKYEKKLYLLHIPTNGIETELIVRSVKEIIKIGFPKFIMTVSLDGLPATHNRLRGVNDNWKKALETYRQLKKLKSKNFDCFLGMTVSDENVSEIEELEILLKNKMLDFDKNDLHFNIAHKSAHYYNNSDFKLDNKEKLAKNLGMYFNKKKYLLNPISFLEMVYQKEIPLFLEDKLKMRCRSGEASVFVNSNGELYPCGMWDRKLGRLNENGYLIVKVLNKNKTWIKEKDLGKCGKCWTPCEAYQSILGDFRAGIFGILGSYARKTSSKNPNG